MAFLGTVRIEFWIYVSIVSEEPPYFKSHPDPVVEVLLNCEPSPGAVMQALAATPGVDHPKVQAMVAISLAEAGLRTAEEAIALAEQAYQQPSHVDLHLLFLASWCSVLLNLKERSAEEVSIIRDAMVSLLSEETPAEIASFVHFVQSYTCASLGDYRGMFEHMDRVLTGVSRQSPHYPKLVSFYMMTHLGQGRGADIETIASRTTLNEFDEKGVFINRVANCAVTGNLEDAFGFIERTRSFPGHK